MTAESGKKMITPEFILEIFPRPEIITGKTLINRSGECRDRRAASY
jgi:hypothetical protein